MKCMALTIVILATVFVSGCARPLATMASHTLQTAADQENDVVWLYVDGGVVRCRGEGVAATCAAVPLP